MDAARQRKTLTVALALLIVIIATILGALAFQAAGYKPCELCLKQRWPYYIGIPLAAVTAAFAWKGPQAAARLGFLLLALLFLGSTLFGAYHSGVEFGFWQGPSDCTGAMAKANSNADFLEQLKTVKVVRCDAAAIRILGLSLAGWNAVVSLGLVAGALIGL